MREGVRRRRTKRNDYEKQSEQRNGGWWPIVMSSLNTGDLNFRFMKSYLLRYIYFRSENTLNRSSEMNSVKISLVWIGTVMRLIHVRCWISVRICIRITLVRIDRHQILHVLRMFGSFLTPNALSSAQKKQWGDQHERNSSPRQTVGPTEWSAHDAGLFENLHNQQKRK